MKLIGQARILIEGADAMRRRWTEYLIGARADAMSDDKLADQLQRLCCAETEGKFFDCVTDNIHKIIAALRRPDAMSDDTMKNEIIRCDNCGKFIPISDIMSGMATHIMASPDSECSGETFESECKSCKGKGGKAELLDFDDAGASDDEPAKGVTVGHVRAWHDQYDKLLTSWAECRDLLSKERASKAIDDGYRRAIADAITAIRTGRDDWSSGEDIGKTINWILGVAEGRVSDLLRET